MNDWKACFPRLYIIYISAPRLSCPALAIKNFNRFPLCYYYIASMRFCQAFQELIIFPNMTDCTNTKRMDHSERPGHSEWSRQPSRQVFRRRPYIPAPESWPSAPILCYGKVEGYRLYCVSGKLTAALLPPRSKATYIYIIVCCPSVQFWINSIQKQPNAQISRNTTSHI